MLLSVPIAIAGLVISIANGSDNKEKTKGNEMVKRYKTKPCEIEAVQWNGFNLEEVRDFVGEQLVSWELKMGDYFIITIRTLEGDMKASLGDYIIKGLRGEFYTCKPDVFEKKYELIS